MLASQRALFDIPHDVCYLNAASYSPLPLATLEATGRYPPTHTSLIRAAKPSGKTSSSSSAGGRGPRSALPTADFERQLDILSCRAPRQQSRSARLPPLWSALDCARLLKRFTGAREFNLSSSRFWAHGYSGKIFHEPPSSRGNSHFGLDHHSARPLSRGVNVVLGRRTLSCHFDGRTRRPFRRDRR